MTVTRTPPVPGLSRDLPILSLKEAPDQVRGM